MGSEEGRGREGNGGGASRPVHHDLSSTSTTSSSRHPDKLSAHSEASPAQLSLQKSLPLTILSALLGALADKNLPRYTCIIPQKKKKSAASRRGDIESGCGEKLPRRYIFSCFAAADNYVCRAVSPELVERDETAAPFRVFFLSFLFFFNAAARR